MTTIKKLTVVPTQEKIENRLGCEIVMSSRHIYLLMLWKLNTARFTNLVIHQIYIKVLHINGLLTNYQYIGLHKLWRFNQDKNLTFHYIR